MILQGKLVFLRALELCDVDLLYKWENDPEVWTISNTLKPFSRYTLEEFIRVSVVDIFESKQLRLMINEVKSNNTVGIIDIFEFDPFHLRAGIGILIAKEYRRLGYASESIKLVKEYLFSVLKVHQVFCNILANNQISISLFEKAGFKICGNKKEWILSQEGFVDEYMLQCFNS